MGMDFSALLRYGGFRKSQRAIDDLERASPSAFRRVLDLWRQARFFPFWKKYKHNAWVDPRNGRQVKRPQSPEVSIALRTTEGFFISFGRGVSFASAGMIPIAFWRA